MNVINVNFVSGQADWSGLNQLARGGQTLMRAFDRQVRDEVGSVAWELVKRAIGATHSALGNVYGDEAGQIAEVLGVSSRDVIAANLAYDVSHFGCSTFIASSSAGLLHGRNLDWWFPRNLLKKHVVIKRMLNAPSGDYAMVSWPGLFGVLTAVGKHRFSVSVNRVSNSQNGTASMVSRAVRGYWPVTWALRHAFDECEDFDAAVRFLKQAPLLSPVLFAIAGTKKSERVIIERDPDDWAVRTSVSGRGLCVTNHYATDEFVGENVDLEEDDTVERLEFLESTLCSRGALDPSSAFRILSSNQLLHDGTQHQVVMSAKTGRLVARVPGEKAVEIRL